MAIIGSLPVTLTNGTPNDATQVMTDLNFIASQVNTNALDKNGSVVNNAAQNWGGFLLNALGAGTALTDATNLGQVQNQGYVWLGTLTGTDTITASATPAITSYVAGQKFRGISAGANTTQAVTLNLNGLGGKNVTKRGTTNLDVGDLPSGAVVDFVYDGTQFQLQTMPTGIVKQIVYATDAGSTGTQTTFNTSSNLNASNVVITPKSATSNIIIIAQAEFSEAIFSTVNTVGTFQIYEVTGVATAVSQAYVLDAAAASIGMAINAPGVIICKTASTGITARSFQMRGTTNNASAACGATSMNWVLVEF